MQNAERQANRFEDIGELSFERALKELESIVGRLERGDVELEESITIYERGDALKAHCDRLLKQAEAKVERLAFGPDGAPKSTEPFAAEGEGR
ncbi:MAG: exodeoxyribonuclease VII small subunit [Hyphomicrobiaceae bacterium]